jgi:predicted ATPase
LAGLNSSGKSSVIQAINTLLSYYYSGREITSSDHASPRLLKSKAAKDTFFELDMYMEFAGNLNLRIDIDVESYALTGNSHPKETPWFQYISAARFGPQNTLGLNPEYKNAEIGDKGDYIIDYIDKNQNLRIDEKLVKCEIPRLRENINAWLQYISPGVMLDYEIKRDINVSYPNYSKILPTETGFGLSYTLPLITALLVPAKVKESVLLLENPEGHLHPKGQVAMGELISLTAASGKQVICETHSDHVINSIRVAVKEKKIDKDSVAILFFEKIDNDTEPHTNITSIQIDKNGSLNEYPDNFLDQWSSQLSRLI